MTGSLPPPLHCPVTRGETAPQRQTPATPTVSTGLAAPPGYLQSHALAAATGAGVHQAFIVPPSAHGTSKRVESSATCGATLSQCDLFSLLLRYLFSRGFGKIDEPLLLRRLAREWDAREMEHARILRQLYAAHRQALFEWRELRLKTSQLQALSGTRPHDRSSDMVQRLLELNDIRAFHVKWKASGVRFEGRNLTSEDLLCGAFALVTNTKDTEPLFKQGLRKLEEDTFNVMQPDDTSIRLYL